MSTGVSSLVHDLKDDHNPTSWLLMSYDKKLTAKVSGTGEAEDYWEEFRSHLSEDEVIFCLLRVVMGDAESRRPKFVFVTWMGEGVGMMKKAKVAIHRGEVAKALGAFHCDFAVDSLGELELAAIKVKLKKAMGADYDMGSNSRSADGKEGNEGSAFAPTKYDSQQSEIKANAAAAYQGGETVKVSGGIGSLGNSAVSHTVTTTVAAPAPAAAAAAADDCPPAESLDARYTCVKKAQARAGFEMDSDKVPHDAHRRSHSFYHLGEVLTGRTWAGRGRRGRHPHPRD
jgi:hypothetical protein